MNVRALLQCKPTSFFNILTLAWPVPVQSKGFVQIKKEKSKNKFDKIYKLNKWELRNRLHATV